ncbi:MAG: CapA family protein [Clostridia bacterium]|nr:CapA family protein [Clostridia bacterium]
MSNKNILKITATGDALFVADIPSEYDSDLSVISSFINKGDVKITNLETNVEKFGDYPNAYSGGTWINVEPHVFDDLTKYGFNYYGTANNHCLDYSYHGLLSTISELDKTNLHHSGTGKNMEEASAPAVIDVDGKKVAILAVTAEYNEASKAGYQTKTLKGRPGVNYVGFNTYYPITPEMESTLREIANYSYVNSYQDILISEGFALPDEDGIFTFGSLKFCSNGSKKRTELNKKDKERIINDIKNAKKRYDVVLVLTHCHDIGKTSHEEVPDYLEELSRACIDAGASAIIGGGTHQLRPVEIYKGKPIFYSLGDFIYQGMRVPLLPADFMIKYGLDINVSAHDALMKRSQNGKIGLQAHKCNFLSAIPYMEFDGDKLIKLTLLPTNAGFDRQGKLNGLPYHAKGEEAKEIFDILTRLSTPYGTKIKLENDLIEFIL